MRDALRAPVARPGSNYGPAIVARAEELADDLRGTCRTLRDFLPEEEESPELLEELDARVMECVECNWWDDTDDMDTTSGEPVCAECRAAKN